MKRMGTSVPQHLMSRFKESLKTEQLGKLQNPCYVVDEILPPRLVHEIDEKNKQKKIRRPRVNIVYDETAAAGDVIISKKLANKSQKVVHRKVAMLPAKTKSNDIIFGVSVLTDDEELNKRKGKHKEKIYK